MRRPSLSILFGFATTVGVLAVGITFLGTRSVCDAILAPGFTLSGSYWAAAHDPLGLLLALGLDVALYGGAAFCVLTLGGKWRRSGRPSTGVADEAASVERKKSP